jgi:peptidoglycan/LPS O-acetylase OafA/YrhL
VIMVVAYHADLPISGGFIGVDVFFVVSGYVITQTLLRELRLNDKLSFSRFYLRRVRRLLPALGLMLASTLILSVLLLPIGAQQVTARTGAPQPCSTRTPTSWSLVALADTSD